MIARTFVIRSVATGAVSAFAMLSEEARYCGVVRAGEHHVRRCEPRTVDWLAIRQELGLGLAPGPLDSESRIAQLIVEQGRWRVAVQYVTTASFACTDVRQAADFLDAQLTAVSSVLH